MTWIAVHVSGRYQVAVAGTLKPLMSTDGRPWSGLTRQAARRKAERLNGTRLPARCSADEFAALTSQAFASPRMIAALRLILVDGKTWRAAAAAAGVTEAGILRATRRLGAASPQRGGDTPPPSVR